MIKSDAISGTGKDVSRIIYFKLYMKLMFSCQSEFLFRKFLYYLEIIQKGK